MEFSNTTLEFRKDTPQNFGPLSNPIFYSNVSSNLDLLTLATSTKMPCYIYSITLYRATHRASCQRKCRKNEIAKNETHHEQQRDAITFGRRLPDTVHRSAPETKTEHTSSKTERSKAHSLLRPQPQNFSGSDPQNPCREKLPYYRPLLRLVLCLHCQLGHSDSHIFRSGPSPLVRCADGEEAERQDHHHRRLSFPS